jgi:hypothetical protein
MDDVELGNNNLIGYDGSDATIQTGVSTKATWLEATW